MNDSITKCITINSVSEYVSAICDETAIKEKHFGPSEFLFRGQPNAAYELIPSLGRYASGEDDVYNSERNMIEMAKYRFPELFNSSLSPLELLSLLQHYGIPTRLLDLSENALVALFFACNEDSNSKGEVFVFEESAFDVVMYPIHLAIADSYRFSRGTAYPLSFFYKSVIEQPYFLEQKIVHQISHENDKDGGEWIKQCCDKPFFVRTPNRVERQKMQCGRYLLFPNMIKELDDGEYLFESRIEPMPKNHKCIVERLIIPGDSKKRILQDLENLGINRERLFADSADIVCEEIKKIYFDRKWLYE